MGRQNHVYMCARSNERGRKLTDLATLYEILDGPMDNRLPPQWAIDKAVAVFGKDEFTDTLYAAAQLIVAERERCANICDREKRLLEGFNTREGGAMRACANLLAGLIRENHDMDN